MTVWHLFALVGFVLSLLLVLVLAAVVVVAQRAWAKLEPVVRPMLSMFAPQPGIYDPSRAVALPGEPELGTLPGDYSGEDGA